MFRRRKHVDVISRLPLCATLSADEIAGLAGIAVEQRYPEGYELTREGNIGRSFFVMLDGQAEVLRGQERVTIRNAGDFFGEIALIAKTPRTATVTSATDISLLVITAQSFRTLLDHQPAIASKVLAALAERLAPEPI